MFDKKTCLIVVCIGIVGPIFTNWLMSFSTPWTLGSSETWMGFFGNYSGGIIGGIVAYIIAKYQIERNKLLEEEKEVFEQLPILINIDLELTKLITALKSLIDITKEDREKRNDSFMEYALNVYKLNENSWSSINKIKDVDLQIDLIVIKNFYTDLCNSLKFNIFYSKLKFNQIMKIEEELSNKKDITLEESERLFKYRIEAYELKDKIEIMAIKKIEVWDMFLDYDYVNKSIEIQARLRYKINSIYPKGNLFKNS